jgi:hypothetical protein
MSEVSLGGDEKFEGDVAWVRRIREELVRFVVG